MTTTITPGGWTVTVWPDPVRHDQFKVIGVDAARRRVIHRDRLTADEAAGFDPAAAWEAGARLAVTRK